MDHCNLRRFYLKFTLALHFQQRVIHLNIFHQLIPNGRSHASSKVSCSLILFLYCNYLNGLITILNILFIIEIQKFIIVKVVLRFELVLLNNGFNLIFH